MSGGSYDYVFGRIDDAARTLMTRCHNKPLRAAFAKHLLLVAKAMHDVEWVDSGDCCHGSEDAAIRACLAPGAELDAAREALEAAVQTAQEVLKGMGGR